MAIGSQFTQVLQLLENRRLVCCHPNRSSASPLLPNKASCDSPVGVSLVPYLQERKEGRVDHDAEIGRTRLQ
jgi:hypothetical protein